MVKRAKLPLLLGLLLLLALLTGCTPAADPAPTDTPAPELVTLADRNELKAFVLEQEAQGQLEFSLKFTGNTNLVTADSLSQILAALYVDVERDTEDRKVFHVSVTEFPGDRMVDAYLSGDTSTLTEEERAALEIAVRMVEEAQAASADPLELEQTLHDLLCDAVTFVDKKPKIKDPAAPPRHMTALGALLDGEAGSYGYADAFYALASIAGLQVDRMCGNETPNDVVMFNTICLEGAWYVVNACYNDAVADRIGYQIFNAGLDAAILYGWGSTQERHPISLVRYEDRADAPADIPQIADLPELRDYVNGQLEQGNAALAFEYTGSGSDILEATFHSMTGGTATLHQDVENPAIYYVYILERPGHRIVDAYFSGDTSLLSADELQAMELAVQMVKDARAETSSVLELEAALHDVLVESMTYYNGPSDEDVYGVSRGWSVLGALLDGRGNCQSYADAFYTLASIAGFQVGKQVVDVDAPGDHICNTIFLYGAWYIVDVTFDDPVDYDGDPLHHTLNIGVDRAQRFYSWREELEYHPIAKVSNRDLLYSE